MPESGIINGATKGLMDCSASSNYGFIYTEHKKETTNFEKANRDFPTVRLIRSKHVTRYKDHVQRHANHTARRH